MRVLAFCTAQWKNNTGSGVRARLFLRDLVNRGAELAIVSPDRPEWAGSAVSSYAWFDLGQPPQDVLMWAAQDFKPDVILGITEGLANLVARTSQAIGCASAFDLHGIGVVEIIELGAGYGPRLRRIRDSLRWLWSVRKARAVTVANPTLLPVIRALNRRAVMAVGCADLENFSPHGPRVELGPADRVQVLYAGNMLRWQGVDLLLEAAERLLDRGEPYDFTLIGSFGSSEEYRTRYRYLFDSGHVRLRDKVDHGEMPTLLRSADVLVIPRRFMMSTYLAFPQKISDYMASGGAIVATDLKPHRYAIEDGQTGILCKPQSDALAEALLRLRSPEIRERVGMNARQFAETHFSMEVIGGIIWHALEGAIHD